MLTEIPLQDEDLKSICISWAGLSPVNLLCTKVCTFAEEFDTLQESTWEMQCVIMLWLSQLVTLPFELALLESNAPSLEAEPGCILAESNCTR